MRRRSSIRLGSWATFRGVAVVAALLVASPVAFGRPAIAAPGDLDPWFVLKPLVDTEARAVATQPDGRFLVAGSASASADLSVAADDFLVLRFFPDGGLDESFGGDRKVTTDFGCVALCSPFPSHDRALAIALQPDGKVIAAGFADRRFALARYNTDGSLDATFGKGGRVVTGFAEGQAVIAALALQTDGRIVAAGTVNRATALARYEANGALDRTFGDGGTVIVDLGPGTDLAYDVLVQPDASIAIVATVFEVASSSGDVAVLRFTSTGEADLTFGKAGVVITDTSVREEGHAIAMHPNGMLVVAGSTFTAIDNEAFLLLRYQRDGRLDPAFGVGGVVTTDFPANRAGVNDLVIEPNGRLVVAGYTGREIVGDFALARYEADGALDVTFGSGGTVSTDLGLAETVMGLALSGADHYVVVGRGEDTAPCSLGICSRRHLLALRYEAVSTADLAVRVTDMPDPATVGQDLTYELTGSNLGPDAAAGVVLSQALPPGSSFVSASAECAYDSAAHSVTCTLGAIGAGAGRTVTVVVRPTEGGVAVSTATIDGIVIDPQPANDSYLTTTDVNGPPPGAGPAEPPPGCRNRPPSAPPTPTCP